MLACQASPALWRCHLWFCYEPSCSFASARPQPCSIWKWWCLKPHPTPLATGTDPWAFPAAEEFAAEHNSKSGATQNAEVPWNFYLSDLPWTRLLLAENSGAKPTLTAGAKSPCCWVKKSSIPPQLTCTHKTPTKGGRARTQGSPRAAAAGWREGLWVSFWAVAASIV